LRLSTAELDEDSAEAILRQCLDLIPPPMLPTQRAMVRSDLAKILSRSDPLQAERLLRDAVSDVEHRQRLDLLGRLLGSLAHVLRRLGERAEAISVLSRAIPLLEETLPHLALESRFDLARLYLEGSNYDRAAEVAESLFNEVTALLEANGEGEPNSSSGNPRAEGGPSTAFTTLCFLAGASAFSAAEAHAGLDDKTRAKKKATSSVFWHRRSANQLAEAEAWFLLAQLTESPERLQNYHRAIDLAENSGEWFRGVIYRRTRVDAVFEVDGAAAALSALSEVIDRIDQYLQHLLTQIVEPDEFEERAAELTRVRWQRLAVVEQGARIRAGSGRLSEALRELDGVAEAFQEIGDLRSERDVIGLRGQIYWEIGDRDAGLDSLRTAAEKALAQGDHEHSRLFGKYLATRLDELGLSQDAEITWARFGS
jgi:tetratricopeptide (TPR) repeat protein